MILLSVFAVALVAYLVLTFLERRALCRLIRKLEAEERRLLMLVAFGPPPS